MGSVFFFYLFIDSGFRIRLPDLHAIAFTCSATLLAPSYWNLKLPGSAKLAGEAASPRDPPPAAS